MPVRQKLANEKKKSGAIMIKLLALPTNVRLCFATDKHFSLFFKRNVITMAFGQLKMIKMTRTVSKHGRGFIGGEKLNLKISTRALYYKTFYGRNLRLFVIS